MGQNPVEDGATWNTAFRFLQDALTEAHQLLGSFEPPDAVEIWVAEGTYRPDQSNANPADGCMGGSNCCPPYGTCNKRNTFNISNGKTITIRGGSCDATGTTLRVVGRT